MIEISKLTNEIVVECRYFLGLFDYYLRKLMKIKGFFHGMSILIFSAFVLIADQISKLIIKSRFEIHDSVEIFGSFFRFTYIENPGMAFGIRWGNGAFFTTFAAFASVVILVYLYRIRHERFLSRFALAVILGGAIGNLIDRFAYGRVIDFLDFGIGDARWPIFNIADASVTMGMIMLISVVIFEKDEGRQRVPAPSSAVDDHRETIAAQDIRRESQ